MILLYYIGFFPKKKKMDLTSSHMGDTTRSLLAHPQFKFIFQFEVCFEGIIVGITSSFIIGYARSETSFSHSFCRKIKTPPLLTFFINHMGLHFIFYQYLASPLLQCPPYVSLR